MESLKCLDDSRTNHRHRHASSDRHHHCDRHSIAGGGGGSKITTHYYMILCPEFKLDSVTSRSIVHAIERTGAWIKVHRLIRGDDERIIEICANERLDGRRQECYPAQEALFIIHDRMLEVERRSAEYRSSSQTVITRLVVPRTQVGSLIGRRGEIIQRMKSETKAHIEVLYSPRRMPRCVTRLEEIIQVIGEKNEVKHAIRIISTRLREEQHHHASHFHRRLRSPQRLSPNSSRSDPHKYSRSRSSSTEGHSVGSRVFEDAIESPWPSHLDASVESFCGKGIVFRILCPADKVDKVVGETDGIVDLLHFVGVDVMVGDPIEGTEERIIIVSSKEDLDDELFPAQEALLHIQTLIVDIVPEGENIITTRLLFQSNEARCLCLQDGTLADLMKETGVDIQILPRKEVSLGIAESDEIIQIVGNIVAARNALNEVTSIIRSYKCQELLKNDLPSTPVSSPRPMIVSERQNDYEALASKRKSVPASKKYVKEVIIPICAASKLVTRSTNALLNISQLSAGIEMQLIEDRAEVKEKIVQIIDDTKEQTERAKTLLEGFISNDKDGPVKIEQECVSQKL